MIIEKERKVANNVDVYFENKRFIVKTVSSIEELKSAQKLRYKSFFLDTHKKINPLGTDSDLYDEYFDHLIIMDKLSKNKVVGTYRLTCSLFTKKFYSQSEFDIDEILALDGIKVELGRAAIHSDYRNGVVFIMLWKGIIEYATMVGAQYIFGCSSIDVKDFSKVSYLLKEIKKESYYSSKYTVITKQKYSMETHATLLKERLFFNYKSDIEIPSLIKFYAKSGAVLLGEPAIDKEFKCIDFFTLIDLDSVINSKRAQKFKKHD